MAKYFEVKQALEIFEKYHDTIVTVVFTKRTDGSVRTLNGKLNCRKYVKNVGMSYDPAEKDLCTIYDLKIGATLPEHQRNRAYRMVNLQAVSEIRAGGKVYRP